MRGSFVTSRLRQSSHFGYDGRKQSYQSGMNQYYVYILSNKNKTTLYTGVTNDLIRRTFEHKEKLIKGFTGIYHVDRLVYYEVHEDIKEAITREKQIKGGSREKKIGLIMSMNPWWDDLYSEIVS